MNNRRRRHAKKVRKMGGVRGQHPSGIVRTLVFLTQSVSPEDFKRMFEKK